VCRHASIYLVSLGEIVLNAVAGNVAQVFSGEYSNTSVMISSVLLSYLLMRL
jgi:hypothetical protein